MADYETRIALGVVIEENNILVIERQQKEIGRNGMPIVWAFPGGKLEVRETAVDAAVREVEEETGYLVKAVETITAENHLQYPVFVYYIGCTLLGKVAQTELPREIVNTMWTPASTIGRLFTWQVNEQVQNYIKARVI